jgi:hypothetical protein
MTTLNSYLFRLYFFYFIAGVFSFLLFEGIKDAQSIGQFFGMLFAIFLFISAHAITFIPIANLFSPDRDSKKVAIYACVISILIEGIGFLWLRTGSFGLIQGVDGMPADAAAFLIYLLMYLPARFLLMFAIVLMAAIFYSIKKNKGILFLECLIHLSQAQKNRPEGRLFLSSL